MWHRGYHLSLLYVFLSDKMGMGLSFLPNPHSVVTMIKITDSTYEALRGCQGSCRFGAHNNLKQRLYPHFFYYRRNQVI